MRHSIDTSSGWVVLHEGDSLSTLRSFPDSCVQCCVTSPPYWGLRDYGVAGQLGLERTPEEYVAKLVGIFREVRRVLRDDGTCWVNLGDSYAAHPGQRKTTDKVGPKQQTNAGSNTIGSRSVDSLKPKDLVGIPWRVAFALQADGWYLRSDIIWSKPNPMPESVRDRPTKAHEYLFLLTKSARYFYDADAIVEPAVEPERQRQDRIGGANGHQVRHSPGAIMGASTTRNRRSVWTITPQPFRGAHFAVFPEKLVEPCILAGCPPGGIVLDPFAGSGTVGVVALRHGRNAGLIELNPDYVALALARIEGQHLPHIPDKQGTGNRRYSGFNKRWDEMELAAASAAGAP